MLKYLTDNGAPFSKIYVGIPMFGNSFELLDRNNELGSVAKGIGIGGQYIKKPGFLAHFEICKIKPSNWTIMFDEEQKAFYAFNDYDWISYENDASVSYKVILNNSKFIFKELLFYLIIFFKDGVLGVKANRRNYG